MLGVTVALVGGGVAVVGGLVAFVGVAVALVGGGVAVVGGLVAFVGVVVAFVGIGFTLVSGLVSVVGGLVAFVGVAVALVGQAFAAVHELLTFVGVVVAFVGIGFTLVSGLVAVVGGLVAVVGGLVAFVGIAVAFVGGSFALERVQGSQFDELAVCLGGEMTKLGLQSPVDRGPVPVSGGTFAEEAFVPPAGAVSGGLDALLSYARTHLLGERACSGGSFAQVFRDLLRSGHFGGLWLDGQHVRCLMYQARRRSCRVSRRPANGSRGRLGGQGGGGDSGRFSADLIKTAVPGVRYLANLAVTWAVVALVMIIHCRQRRTRCVQRCELGRQADGTAGLERPAGRFDAAASGRDARCEWRGGSLAAHDHRDARADRRRQRPQQAQSVAGARCRRTRARFVVAAAVASHGALPDRSGPGPASRNVLLEFARPLTVGPGRLVRFVGGFAVAIGWPDVRIAGVVVVIVAIGPVSQFLELAIRLSDEAQSLRSHGPAGVGQAHVVSDLFMALIIGTMIFLWHIWGALFQYSRTERMTRNSTRTVRSPHLLLKKPLDPRRGYPRDPAPSTALALTGRLGPHGSPLGCRALLLGRSVAFMAKGQPSRRRHLETVLTIVATAAAYLLAAQPGLLKQLGEPGMASLVWPASGVALAAILIFGLRAWPGVALGAFVATWVAFNRPPLAALGIAVEATVGAALAYVLLRRAGFKDDLARVRDAVALVVCGAGVGMVTDAAIRSGVLVLAGIEPASEYGSLMLHSWLGSGLGILVVTPFLLVLCRISLRRTVEVWRLVEAVSLFVCTLGVSWWVIAGGKSGNELFLVFPLLIWAAWRFQLEGAAPCVVVVSFVTVSATVRGLGPFSGTDPQTALIHAQTFVAATTLATLFLAVAVTERNDARDELDRTARELVRAVNILGERLRPDKASSADSGRAAPEHPDPRTRVRRERIQPPPDG